MSRSSYSMRNHVRKNITLPAGLDARLRKLAKARGASQSGLIVHLVALGLATESGEGDPLLRYLGSIEGPADLSSTVDKTVYGADRPR
jgi:CopG-like RHH_1 or ribbon-helix-helix domain, RHH_5